MSGYWASFAAFADPGASTAGGSAPAWPAFAAENGWFYYCFAPYFLSIYCFSCYPEENLNGCSVFRTSLLRKP